jgi:hypothetical protein
MAMYLNGELIVDIEHVFGVRWPSLDEVMEMDSESEARDMANEIHGELVVSTVFRSDWKTIEPIGAKV